MAPITLNEVGGDVTAGTAAKPGGKAGVWRGQQVTQKLSAASIIQNALEEIAELGAERSEDEKLKKDEFHDLGEASSRLKAKVDEIEGLIDKMGDDASAGEVEKFVADKARFRNYDPDQLLQEAKRRFKDPSWQFIALAALENSLADEPSERLTAAEAKQSLLASSASRVWGGINITPQAKKITASPARMSELRDFYADSTLGYGGILQAYDKVIEQFGDNGFERGAKFLLSAAGDDLGAMNSSMPKERLRAVLDELYSIEVIATMHEGSRTMLTRLKVIQPGTVNISVAGLMRSILTLAKRDWVDTADISRSVELMGATSPFAQINVLREMRHMVVRLPLKVTSAQPEARQRLITAVQQALDEAAQLEDEELGNGEGM